MQQFLQSAVHDLRAAHRRAAIAAELLVEAATDLERKDLAAQMLQGFSQTEELLTGISKYATVLTGTNYSINSFPVASAVRFALANLDPIISETGAQIVVGELPEIQGDRDRLTELFEHLLSNSLKFSGTDPLTIAIAARRVPEGWLFSVQDNGVGIARKYRDRLFVAFRRLHGADVPGAGLGLVISRKIVEAHGGRIWIEDRDEQGVTFCFILRPVDGS